ncbi:hypothetical protein A9200_08510 [Maribacter hydrothermalis]|uniref:Uncharacterized protein n=1 Tax=Maribacter hydrothermalis TaxID=1836467 RepID=A0A1B7Z171_9FLAO|nr:hypothetical protein BTR34_12615 [Maribacter hydrothermalis]OBR36463.1 hypothetical protein A9200_08510 [Maribacter hydrothermalis]
MEILHVTEVLLHVLLLHVALQILEVQELTLAIQQPEELLAWTKIEPIELVEAQELHQDIALQQQEVPIGIIQIRIRPELEHRAVELLHLELLLIEILVQVAIIEAEIVIQPVDLLEVLIPDLTEALVVTQEVVLVVAHTGALAAAVLEVQVP